MWSESEEILCDIENSEIEDEDGSKGPGVIATCQGCGAQTQSFGESSASVNRCLAIMQDECTCPFDKKWFVAA